MILAWQLSDLSQGARYGIICIVVSLLPLAIVWATTHRRRRPPE